MDNESSVDIPLNNIPITYENPLTESIVTSVPADVTETTEITNVSSVSNVLDEIAINTKQTADCLTTLVAFACILLFAFIGRWLYNIFKDLFF